MAPHIRNKTAAVITGMTLVVSYQPASSPTCTRQR